MEQSNRDKQVWNKALTAIKGTCVNYFDKIGEGFELATFQAQFLEYLDLMELKIVVSPLQVQWNGKTYTFKTLTVRELGKARKLY